MYLCLMCVFNLKRTHSTKYSIKIKLCYKIYNIKLKTFIVTYTFVPDRFKIYNQNRSD